MKIGLAGFAGSGKSTVFHWLTGVKPDPGRAQQGQSGNAKIPDERLDWLSAKFKPKKTTPASIDLIDTPGLLIDERRDNPRRLAILRDTGGLVVVLQQELNLLQQIVAVFEKGQSAATFGLNEDEEKAIRSFQLLTLKPELALVNIGDAGIGRPLPAELLQLAPKALAAPAKLELELEELAPEDRQVFMSDLGLTASSRGQVLRDIYSAMNQIVFFTIGEDECRAWSLDRGQNAVEGAGKIHTDLADRFVRAEVVGYDDFYRVGSMKEAKTHGVYRLEGKTYVVQDGDIMHIL